MTERTPGFWLGGAAVVVVLAALVAGLFVIGGPGEARLERLDTERTEDLRRIEQAVDEVWRHADTLPPSLDSLRAANRLAPDDLTDPTTGEPYDYRVLSDSTYELCATFDRASDDTPTTYSWTDIGNHGAGRHCFTLYPPRDR
jgi:hypothetical protein